ncbi:glycosyltransferase family 2 protein [Carboxylicivirga sp. M1479]|uniref:glycosyltransferase n=1 Tax=Carboxylicivirga sp. M1479 TaxID=2594476 RepID=UPI00117829AE|nr:glycosyltransferase [Carboxylicivirga sp. M1479]TRX65869.1 glycosyltransferase family 2 protein [Carboxylicivirga sp. M1479]
MISICIPVYNVDIRNLVNDLSNQAQAIDLKIEILVFDDGSTEAFKKKNRHTAGISNVIYNELDTNIGRAAIRNLMANSSHFPNLIFIDSDSQLMPNYLRNYLDVLVSDYQIVCGGRVHPKVLPHANKSLRWTVGKKKEDHAASVRQKGKSQGFISNNFIIKKDIFDLVQFDDNITQYGHEDTLFGIEMRKRNVKIDHIDNPIIHIGLEDNEEFLDKTKISLETLLFICNKMENCDLLKEQVTLLRYFQIVKSLGLSHLLSKVFNKYEKLFERNLLSRKPMMLIFDVYKLSYFAKLNKMSKTTI